MTFEELRKIGISGETILMTGTIERVFIGFIDRFVVISDNSVRDLERWSEENIKTWTIKKPERETIKLFLTFDHRGAVFLCDKKGYTYDQRTKRVACRSKELKENISSGVFCKIYADDFKRVEVEN